MMTVRFSQSVVITLSFILLMQSFYLPMTVSVLSAIVIGYFGFKAFKTNQHWEYSRLKQYFFVIMAVSLIYLQYGSLIGVEAGCALLWVFLLAKSFELKTTRDLVVLLNFALFVIASILLYAQSMLNAVGVVVAMILVFTGFYRIHLQQYHTLDAASLKSEFKSVLRIVVFAMPLFVVLFLFMPRLPPLWYVPIKSEEGVTGLSDEIRIGDIASLSQSRELAFRVLMDPQHMLARSELYWRAMVLDHYEGQIWRSSTFSQMVMSEAWLNKREQAAIQHFDYQYLPSQLNTKWISALETSRVQQAYYHQRQDGGIVPARAPRRIQPIALKWIGSQSLDTPEHLSEHSHHFALLMRSNLQYERTQDPRAQALAKALWQLSNSEPQQYIQAVLKWFQNNGFRYTLKPGRLEGHLTDQFLFGTRQGFCEHYASSFTLLMRYVGIPARVVVGYQGGAWAPDRQSWEVRQLDAHAWTEVWLGDQGWVRVDPTAVISPDRIDAGMQNYLQDEDQSHGLDRFALQQHQWLTKVQIWSDYLNYQWQSKIVGYDAERQKDWLARLGLRHAGHYILAAMFSFAVLMLLLFFIRWYRHQFYAQNLAFEVQRMSQKMTHAEWKKQPSESVYAWIKRLKPYARSSEPFDCLMEMLQERRYKQHMQAEDEKLMVDLLKQCAKELNLK